MSSQNVVYFNNNIILGVDSEYDLAEVLIFYSLGSYVPKELFRDSILSGHEYVVEVLNGHRSRCFDSFRMEKNVFKALCSVPKEKFFLKDSKYILTEEQVAIFLYIISQNERHQMAVE
ncbi:hypothetical protein PanWU01x14_081360 [Parasponia andersonii]|uniref:DUF8040 domain-containing protein n=1 Tax=Parasponia andersonii TaxID=3476 RepID=A0A2P5DB10_PARAD|nr:hypothetical protein PanWU01x14_081360 [Parasponia andersonii]